jgi:hypothetical protein
LGCPAKGNSATGVKMRTVAMASLPSGGGSMKTVSERLNSVAMACIVAPSRPRPSGNTASGLPPNGRLVKTSSVTKSYAGIA